MLLYNTQTRRKEELVPGQPGKVTVYGCGPTVYHYFHIGNGRTFVVFDTLRRHLEHRGYEVRYVQNLTDIDDKMIQRANAEGVTVGELARRFIEAYFEDADALGIRRASVHPRATENIPEIVSLIERLEQKGYAYNVSGDVYFDTQAYGPRYGKLSGQNLSDLESGARVNVDEAKRHPSDFALWKAQKPGEPAWDSPWGPGRPGWHIECSAMSMKYLGETIDLHCGGQDLVFPHHENEMAQSEGATGKPFARCWMHIAFLNMDNEKMSKSLGNFLTVRDIRKTVDPGAIRLFLLSAHYRSPLNFSPEQMEQAKAAFTRLRTARDNLLFLLGVGDDRQPEGGERAFLDEASGFLQKFEEAMDDDLNTADALGALFELVKRANIALAPGCPKAAAQAALDAFDAMTGVLGLAMESVRAEGDGQAAALLARRAKARQEKRWAESDRIRDELKALGYVVEDTPQGQKLRKA